MKKGLFFSLSFIGSIGVATALPLVLFAFLGRFLDHKFSTRPTIFIICLVVSAGLSFLMLRQITKKAIEDIKKLN